MDPKFATSRTIATVKSYRYIFQNLAPLTLTFLLSNIFKQFFTETYYTGEYLKGSHAHLVSKKGGSDEVCMPNILINTFHINAT